MSRASREVAIALIYVAAAVLCTWPLARLLPIAVAYAGDPLINTYILAWDAHALANAPSRVYHANIFFPAPYALALSENLFGLWPLAAPLLALTTPITTHNVLLLLGIAFSGYGASVLGRVITGSTASGIVAGFVYGFCAWRFVHLSHLQHVWGGWLPLILAAIVYYDRKRDVRAAALVFGAIVMNGLTNLHYLVFSVIVIAAAVSAMAVYRSERRSIRTYRPMAVALIGAFALLTLILWPYRIAHERYELRGGITETARYSASLHDWISPDPAPEPERNVFPGYMQIAVAIAGLLLATRRSAADLRIWTLIAILLIVIGVVFSTGLSTPLYSFFFDQTLLVRGIRAPARWAVVAYMGMAVLAAIAVRRRSLLVAGAISAACIAPIVAAAPIRWYLMPAEIPHVYHWLQQKDLSGGVIELPIGGRDFQYLRGAAWHHKPIVNGASGGAPAHYVKLREIFSSRTIPAAALDTLESVGVSTIIVHSDALGSNKDAVRRWLSDALAKGRIAYLGRFEAEITGDFVFSTGGRGRPPDAALEAFLAGRAELPNNIGPFGNLQLPLPGYEAFGRLEVRGWALSSAGVKSVRLWFANKSCSVLANLEPYPEIQHAAPYHSTASARFKADFDRRPCGSAASDILVEITDHEGIVTTLPHVWFRWE